MTVYALCNQKGGTGKTTTTWHLSDALARAGRKVLVVDMDPQGNLTTIAAADQVMPDDVGIADVLSRGAKLSITDVIVTGALPGVDVVPTAPESDALYVVRDELVVGGIGREKLLRRALEPVRDLYDDILIDCGPSLDQLTINALVAADEVVILSWAALFSAMGIGRMVNSIEEVRETYNPDLGIRGVIVNMYEAGTISGAESLDEIAASVNILGYPIPKRVLIKDSSEAQTSLADWGSSDARKLATIFQDIAATLI